MSSAAWGHQLDLLVRARTPLIWVRSNEEARVESLLGEAAQRLARPVSYTHLTLPTNSGV